MKNLLSIFIFVFLAGNNYAQKPENYIITNEGNVAELYGDINLEPGELIYFIKNEKGKKEAIRIDEDVVKLLVVGPRIFVGLMIKNNKQRLQEIIAFNDKYILTGKTRISEGSGEKNFLTVRDKDYRIVQEELYIPIGMKKTIPKNIESIKRNIERFFDDCPLLIKAMNDNVSVRRSVYAGITNFNCGNSKELFPDVPRLEGKKEEEMKYKLPAIVSDIDENYYVWKGGEKGATTKDYPTKVAKNLKFMQHLLKDLQYIVYEKRMYLSFKMTHDFYEIHEVVAYNEKYILAYDLIKKFTYHIYDRSYLVVESDINKGDIVKKLETYFSGCPELAESMQKDLPSKKKFENDFNYYNCGNASPLMRSIN